MTAIPDCLLVWNEAMAKEANLLHGVPKEHIEVVGGPQYEIYRKLAPKTSELEGYDSVANKP